MAYKLISLEALPGIVRDLEGRYRGARVWAVDDLLAEGLLGEEYHGLRLIRFQIQTGDGWVPGPTSHFEATATSLEEALAALRAAGVEVKAHLIVSPEAVFD